MEKKDLIKSLNWIHIESESGKVVEVSQDKEVIFPEINVEDAVNTPKKIKEWFEKDQSCHIMGSLDVTKVTG
jgi:hypothetical protein